MKGWDLVAYNSLTFNRLFSSFDCCLPRIADAFDWRTYCIIRFRFSCWISRLRPFSFRFMLIFEFIISMQIAKTSYQRIGLDGFAFLLFQNDYEGNNNFSIFGINLNDIHMRNTEKENYFPTICSYTHWHIQAVYTAEIKRFVEISMCPLKFFCVSENHCPPPLLQHIIWAVNWRFKNLYNIRCVSYTIYKIEENLYVLQINLC